MQNVVEAIGAARTIWAGSNNLYHWMHDDKLHTIDVDPQHKEAINKHLKALRKTKKRKSSGRLPDTLGAHIRKKLKLIFQKKDSHVQLKTRPPMPRRRSKRSKRKRTRKNNPSRGLKSSFPKSQLVKLKSYHLGAINPAASGVTGWCQVNINNPIDPLGTGVTFSLNSDEHHPRYWDIYEALYAKFEVISCKVSVEFLMPAETTNHALFMVPTSTGSIAKTTGMINNVILFATRLKEAHPRAIVKLGTSSTNSPNHYHLSKSVNIRQLEGLKKGDYSLLQGTTGATGSEAAPTRTPRMFFGIGALGSVDLSNTHVNIKIEYIVRFSDLAVDHEGVDV